MVITHSTKEKKQWIENFFNMYLSGMRALEASVSLKLLHSCYPAEWKGLAKMSLA